MGSNLIIRGRPGADCFQHHREIRSKARMLHKKTLHALLIQYGLPMLPGRPVVVQ